MPMQILSLNYSRAKTFDSVKNSEIKAVILLLFTTAGLPFSRNYP
jgi:hypothetical protein